jgi:tRNA threonylcarbamoyladenosine modification (KEOPS) complex  Pcc1 subunit
MALRGKSMAMFWAAAATVPRSSTPAMNRRSPVVQITLTHEEAATLRGALNSYVSDLRMEVADTDSKPFRENLKREEAMLKKLLQQLDAELAAPGTSS